MAKKESDFEGITLGTDAWNVADGYTKLKILRQLIMLDRWEIIAQYEVNNDTSDTNQKLICSTKKTEKSDKNNIVDIRKNKVSEMSEIDFSKSGIKEALEDE